MILKTEYHIFKQIYRLKIFFKVGKKIFVKEESAGERGTSFAEMNRTGSSNAKKGPSVDYNAFKDFFNSETTGHILAAWLDFTGMESIEGMSLHVLGVVLLNHNMVLVTL